MVTYWKKGYEVHAQKGFEWGNDIDTSYPDAQWGTYCPMSDEEHIRAGWTRISPDEAGEMVENCGNEIETA